MHFEVYNILYILQLSLKMQKKVTFVKSGSSDKIPQEVYESM